MESLLLQPSRLPFFQVKLQLQRHLSRARRLIARVTELQVAVGMSPARYKCDIPTFVPTCTTAAAFTADILSSETATVSRHLPRADQLHSSRGEGGTPMAAGGAGGQAATPRFNRVSVRAKGFRSNSFCVQPGSAPVVGTAVGS